MMRSTPAAGAGPRPTCLLFDFGGTLDSDGIAWKERFGALYRAEGLDIPEDAFDRVFYDADDPLVGGIDIDADLEETVRRLVDNIEAGLASVLAPDAARGRRVAARFLADTYAALARNRSVLEALGGRYRLGVVSNFYGNLPAVCRGLGLSDLFGVIVDSEQVGVDKPDPAIFRAAMQVFGAEPAATVMIGDSLRRDREGARRCGLGFIWIAPGGAPVGADYPAVASLHGLTGLLL